MKSFLLRIHRWVAAIFALPLIAIVITGLILSVEPIVYDRHVTGAVLDSQVVLDALLKHDPEGKARGLAVRAYEGTLMLTASAGAQPKRIDLQTNELIDGAQTRWSDVFTTSRRLHETLLLNMSWLVTASTIALLGVMVLGYVMGWVRPRNTARGWHRATGWVLAPLLVLSPLTGLAIALGVSFGGSLQPAAPGPRIALVDAVRMVAAERNLADVVWIRPMGGGLRARIFDGREARVFLVGQDGLVRSAANWPRALHEGNWAGAYSGAANVVTSLALIGLICTGSFMWAQRTLRNTRRLSKMAQLAKANT